MKFNSGRSDAPLGAMAFVASGLIDESAARIAAEAQIEHLAARAPRPLIFARIKIRREQHRPPPEQFIAQGTLDVSGKLIRAETAAPTALEAINGLTDRLDRSLRRLADRRETVRGRPPATPPGSWRSGDLPDVRPRYFERPPGERRIVRTKTYAPDRISVEDAMFDLEVLDHRFFLFTDLSDGVESVIYEDGNDVVLRRVNGGTPPMDPPAPATVNAAPAPGLTLDEAVEQLDLSDAPFVFFRDVDTDRAAVVYRRYDGHYGLVTSG